MTHPDLSEGRLAKLRAAVVNARALADVARTIGLGEHIQLGKGEEATGGREKSSILSDTVEALIGAVYLSGGFDEAGRLVHLLFDPMLEAAAAMGAGLDWKTSLQELSAVHEPRRARVRHRGRGPRPHEDLHRPGPGRRPAARPRRRPFEEGGRAAGCRVGLPHAERGAPRRRCRRPTSRRLHPRRAMPELPEVEVVRRGLEAHVLRHPIRSVEVLHPRPVRRHAGGPADFAARLTGRTFTAAHRRGKYLWLAARRRRRAARSPRHERPDAGAAGRRTR